jgi:hypothetical protein
LCIQILKSSVKYNHHVLWRVGKDFVCMESLGMWASIRQNLHTVEVLNFGLINNNLPWYFGMVKTSRHSTECQFLNNVTQIAIKLWCFLFWCKILHFLDNLKNTHPSLKCIHLHCSVRLAIKNLQSFQAKFILVLTIWYSSITWAVIH